MDDKLAKALSRALLALRITLGLFLLQWGVEKFVVRNPPPLSGATSTVWSYRIPWATSSARWRSPSPFCIFVGQFRTIAYGAALFLHAVTVIVTWRPLLDPWGDPINHLFTASIPVLGGFLALFLLRHWDRGLLEK